MTDKYQPNIFSISKKIHKYSILLDHKILFNVESKKEFHKLIINVVNDSYKINFKNMDSKSNRPSVFFNLDIEELRKNAIYIDGFYLLINDMKIYLVEKSTFSTNWLLFLSKSMVKIKKEWILIESLSE